MGLLKKLYAETQRVRHTGSLAKDFGGLNKGVSKRVTQAKTNYSNWKHKKEYESYYAKMNWGNK